MKIIPCWYIQTCVYQRQLDEAKKMLTLLTSSSRVVERMNTKWRIYKLTNLTVFSALLKDVSMGCKDALSPKLLLKNHTVNCLKLEETTETPYNDNLSWTCALVLRLYRLQKPEEKTSKNFNTFINRVDGVSANQFQRVHISQLLRIS